MKYAVRQRTRWLLPVVLVFSLIAGSGCSPKPITKATLDYFYGLVNQQYWQRQAVGLTLNDESGTEQLVVAPTETSDKQQYVLFGDVAVRSSSQKSGPTDAVIKVKVFDGTIEKDIRVRVDDANLATLQKTLSDAFESKAQRDQQLVETVRSFLDAMTEADFETAIKCTGGVNTMPELEPTEVRNTLALLQRVTYEVGRTTVEGDKAEVNVKITTLDWYSIYIEEAAKAFSYGGAKPNVDFDADYYALFPQYFRSAIDASSSPTVTSNVVRIMLDRVNGSWIITSKDDALLNALIGNMPIAWFGAWDQGLKPFVSIWILLGR